MSELKTTTARELNEKDLRRETWKKNVELADKMREFITFMEKEIARETLLDAEGVERCPRCGSVEITDNDDIQFEYCPNCGQHLWNGEHLTLKEECEWLKEEGWAR